MVSVGWMQAWNQVYPGAAQYLQNAGAIATQPPTVMGAAKPRFSRQSNPAWDLAILGGVAAASGVGYVAWRSHELHKACAPPDELVPGGEWLTADGSLDPLAEQVASSLFATLYETEGIRSARKMAWAVVQKLAASDDCPSPDNAPRVLVGKMRTVIKALEGRARDFLSLQGRVGNPREKNAGCYPGVEAAIGLDPAFYGYWPGYDYYFPPGSAASQTCPSNQRMCLDATGETHCRPTCRPGERELPVARTGDYRPMRQPNGRIGIGISRQNRLQDRMRQELQDLELWRQQNNYRAHPSWPLKHPAIGTRMPNQPGAIAVALGIPPTHYGQPGPWSPPLAYQPHFPANNPMSSRGQHPGSAVSLRNHNPPTALMPAGPGAAWAPSTGYGTGQYGMQYAPNRTPYPGLPQNAPWVSPRDLVGPTDTIVVGQRQDDEVAVGGRAARAARNMWGAMASCSGGKKTCGKSLDFRDPQAMAAHRNPQPHHAAAQGALAATTGLIGSAVAGPIGAVAGSAVGSAMGAHIHRRHANHMYSSRWHAAGGRW